MTDTCSVQFISQADMAIVMRYLSGLMTRLRLIALNYIRDESWRDGGGGAAGRGGGEVQNGKMAGCKT